MKCRVIYKPDDTVSVIHCVPAAKREDETQGEFLERVYLSSVQGTELEGLPYDDLDPTILPDRTDRDKWRKNQGGGVRVDHTVVTGTEMRRAVEDRLDAELAKSAPDTVLVLKLQRKLEKSLF